MNEAIEDNCTLCGSELEGVGECVYDEICTACENDIHVQNIKEYAGMGEE